MAEMTTRYDLPLIQTGQGQKELTHNEALHRIDAFMHLLVESRAISVPPANPVNGAIWIVASVASGAWTGQEGRLAEWDGSAWRFTTSRDGAICVIGDEGILAVHAGGAWKADFLPLGGLSVRGANMFGAPRADILEPVGGSVIDAETRAVIGQLLAYLRLQGVLGG